MKPLGRKMLPRLTGLIVFDLRDNALTKASAALEEPMKAKMSTKPDSMHGLKAQDWGIEDSHRCGAKLVETTACNRHSKKTDKKSPRCDTSQVSNKAIICMASYGRYWFSLLVLFVSFCFALFCDVLWKVILSASSHWLHLQATAWCRGRDQKWSSPHPEGNILHKPRPVSGNFRRVKSCKSLVVSKPSKWSEVKN